MLSCRRSSPFAESEAGSPFAESEAGDGEDSGFDGYTEAEDPPEPGLQWARHLITMFGLAWMGKKLAVMTMCSGTDSPVYALRKLIGNESVRHAIACDIDPACQEFVLHQHSPEHVYGDVSTLQSGGEGAPCRTCGPSCKAYQRECIDLMIAGFPCKPFSDLNADRWKDDVHPMSHPQAYPFKFIIRYLNSAAVLPLIVILENVYSVLKRSNGKVAPVTYIEGYEYTDKVVVKTGLARLRTEPTRQCYL